MLNLRPYNKKDPFLLYKEIVSSKIDKVLVKKLQEINDNIQKQFNVHLNESTTNTLENITALNMSEQQKADLRNLYSSRSKYVIEIKNSIITSDDNRIRNLCQYCTINTVGPMDHIMPKGDFPEFSVHARNLFPCCAECNSYKSKVWLAGGNRQFLNLYLDTLPNEQYLFVNLNHIEDVPEVEFYLDNRNNINKELFELISSHYDKLKLLERFKFSSHAVIADLKYTIETMPTYLTTEEIISMIIETQSKRKKYNGSNYWECVLIVALIENPDFLNFLNIK